MNIYRLYIQNGNCAGFWIQHRSWQNMCARVQTIGGRRSGAFPISATVEDYAGVLAQFFDVRSGRPVPAHPSIEQPEDCGYVLIAQPPWYTRPITPSDAATETNT